MLHRSSKARSGPSYFAPPARWAWQLVLPLAGGTLTGPLILNANPTAALGAATKQYADAFPGVRYDGSQSLTSVQQTQARTNIGASQQLRTRTIRASGSGNYSPPTGCVAFNVLMCGGGGGGGGGGTSGGGTGTAGGSTTFAGMTANGGSGGGPGGAGALGGTSSGGDVNITGGSSGFGWGAGFGSGTNLPGGQGGASFFGGGGYGGWPNSPGGSAGPLGAGGGGGGGPVGTGFGGAGGSAGGTCEKLYVAPFSAPYAYVVGANGTAGGAAGGGGQSGAMGRSASSS
jgi:hypothetical protein